MDNKVSVWKANLNSGLIIGLLGVVYTLIMYFLDLTLKQWQGFIWLAILVFALYLAIRSYRDKSLKGFITYGQSLGAGVVIMLYYAIIAAVFGYILYAIIDPGLIDKMKAMAETKMIERGIPEAAIEQGMKVQAKIMVPWVLALSGIFTTMFWGTVFSLIVSIFTRKEGNPLIDEAIEE